MANTLKIALAGEGGQGVQIIAQILGEAAYEEGKEALYIPNFGVEQRGGVSVAYLQISDQPIGSPKFSKGNIVVALSDRAIPRTQRYVDENTIYIYDSAIEGISEDDLPKNAKKILAIPALETANSELHPRVFNIIILGAVLQVAGVVSIEEAKSAVEKKLGAKFEQNPKLREMNFKALARGVELVEKAL